MQSVKTEHKGRVDNTKGVQKKRTRYARYNRSTTKKTSLHRACADKIQKGTYRLKLQRTWSLFELIISQIFANKIFPTKRLCWWNESCGFYVNIIGAIKQIQWSALIRISSSMSRCFTSLNYLCIIWENSQANWRLCLYLSCNPPSEGESFHPFGIVTNYTGRLMFLHK